MDEKDNSRSSLQTAADLGRAAKAAYRIAQAAAVSGVHGAAAAAVKETVPALVKFLLVVLLIMIVIPMVVFTALPNIFFGYDSSDTASVIHMTEQAMRIGGAYMSLDDFERTQIDSIVTGIAAEYEADGTAIDHKLPLFLPDLPAALQLRPSPWRAASRTDKLLLGRISQHRLHGGHL